MHLILHKTAVITGFGLTALMASLNSAAAATVYSTGFESPGMAAGSQLVGQDAWVAGAPFLSPNAAVVSTAAAQSGTQSVRVRGQDMVHADEVGPELDAVGSYRRPVNYNAGAAGTPIVQITSSVRLDGPVATGDFFSANIAARSADGALAELSISSDGILYGYLGGAGTSVTIGSITLGAWHTLGINVDFDANLYSFSVDGTTSGSFPFDAGFTSDVLLRGAIVTYAKPDAGGNLRNNYTAYFDNFSINAVPEPTTTGVLLLSACGLLMRRRAVRHQHGYPSPA